MSESAFDIDVREAQRELAAQRSNDRWRRILTCGLWNNKARIEAATARLAECEMLAREYHSLAECAAELDTDPNMSASMDGVRLSEGKGPDLPAVIKADYGPDWDVIRNTALSRDGYRCQEEDGRCDGPLDVHHVLPLSKRGTNRLENLVTLCRYHHSAKHQHMKR